MTTTGHTPSLDWTIITDSDLGTHPALSAAMLACEEHNDE